MSLTRNQQKVLEAAIMKSLTSFQGRKPSKLLGALKTLVEEDRIDCEFFDILKIVSFPSEIDNTITNNEDASQYVKGILAQFIQKLESGRESEEVDNRESIHRLEEKSKLEQKKKNEQEEQYKKQLLEAPVFVCCRFPREAFNLEENTLKPLKKEIVNAITIGGRDSCRSLDESEKLDDVLQHGFTRPDLTAAFGDIQVVLKFKNMFDLDDFRGNTIEGIKKVVKYYTPLPRMDFSGIGLVRSKEERLKKCLEHHFADIEINALRQLIIAAFENQRDFIQKQIDRLLHEKAAESNKGKIFARIRDDLNEMVADLKGLARDKITEQKLQQYEAEIKRMDQWIREAAAIHRDTGVKGFLACTAFRNPKSLEEFEHFSERKLTLR